MRIAINISHENLESFIRLAHSQSYANPDVPRVESTRLNSQDYHYEQGDLVYHDTYFGGRDFIGEEIVYQKQTPIWGMNYHGYFVSPDANEHEFSTFLRLALRQEDPTVLPIRGLQRFENGNSLYTLEVTGDLNRFVGVERIYQGSQLIYQLYLHGGLIS